MGILSGELGPLKVWQWMLAGTGLVLAFVVFAKVKGKNSAGSAQAQQQLLAAEEAAAANAAQATAVTTPNYNYGANGLSAAGGRRSWQPAAATTAPAGTVTPSAPATPWTTRTWQDSGSTGTQAPAPAPVTASTAPAPVQSAGAGNGSWTDTGQLWTAGQLASKLGIPVTSLHPSNGAGANALNAYLADPKTTKLIPKGGAYTFTRS